MEINIIGAGPIGSYTAYLLSKKGYQVNLFEEHQQIGKPIQCTGLLTQSINKFIKLKKQFLLNIIKHIELVSPSNKRAIINKKELVIDRTTFDQYLINLAQNNGSQLYLNHKFIGKKDNFLIFKNKGKTIKIKKSITIGADGPLSPTAKAFKFPNQNQFYYGFQAIIRGNFDPTTYQVNFSQKIAPGFFSWIVPEDTQTARIGLATTQKNSFYFNQLIKRYKKKIISLQGGLIPVYNHNIKTQHQNTYLIGDAATQVKATTGGGIIPGLESAHQLVKAITQNQNYTKLWKRKIGQNLKKHLIIRNALNKFSDQDYDYLIKTISQKKIQRYDREHLNLWELAKISLQNPKLIYFTRHLF
jgi:geranylgeranyl reductase family protein